MPHIAAAARTKMKKPLLLIAVAAAISPLSAGFAAAGPGNDIQSRLREFHGNYDLAKGGRECVQAIKVGVADGTDTPDAGITILGRNDERYIVDFYFVNREGGYTSYNSSSNEYTWTDNTLTGKRIIKRSATTPFVSPPHILAKERASVELSPDSSALALRYAALNMQCDYRRLP